MRHKYLQESVGHWFPFGRLPGTDLVDIQSEPDGSEIAIWVREDDAKRICDKWNLFTEAVADNVDYATYEKIMSYIRANQ